MPLASLLTNALNGDYSHVHVRKSLHDLNGSVAGQVPPAAPHSIYQIVQHLVFWQEIFLERLAGIATPEPTEDFWPSFAAPADEDDWNAVRGRLFEGLERACRYALEAGLDEPLPLSPEKPRMEALRIIASHTSYHTGQIVLLRQLLGAWPPSQPPTM
jgi:uncharacterized damage-inducible protein DinB